MIVHQQSLLPYKVIVAWGNGDYSGIPTTIMVQYNRSLYIELMPPHYWPIHVPDPTLKEGKESGDIGAFSWSYAPSRAPIQIVT